MAEEKKKVMWKIRVVSTPLPMMRRRPTHFEYRFEIYSHFAGVFGPMALNSIKPIALLLRKNILSDCECKSNN